MPFVLDCSVTMGWLFPESTTPLSSKAQQLAEEEMIYVPAIWPLEVANVLCTARRRGHATLPSMITFISLLESLDISEELPINTGGIKEIFAFATDNDLTAYDATYLELARRRHLPLATLDKAMARAAIATGVELVEA